MKYFEANFDGLVGPTHNYAGLALGNVASQRNKHLRSNPRAAALQGLKKMHLLAERGVRQGFLPPHPRPALDVLRALGFSGKPEQIVERVGRSDPELLAAVYSASNMWVANAATVTPSCDALDGKMHWTPANLVSNFHRSIESPYTAKILKAVFANTDYFVHHKTLPATIHFADEGAANHTRLCANHDSQGMHLFVYGMDGGHLDAGLTVVPRQSLQASQRIAQNHCLQDGHTVFIQQSETALNAGVFHNDVIAVGNENCLLYHEAAFANAESALETIHSHYASLNEGALCEVRVCAEELTLTEAVQSYLFNSQLVSIDESENMLLLAPEECSRNERVVQVIERVLESNKNPINEVTYLDLKQSMLNGGGPACLRLRVVLNEREWQAIPQQFIFTETNAAFLREWIERYYRDSLVADDLRDPALILETAEAYEALYTYLKIK